MWQNYLNAVLGFCVLVVAFMGLIGSSYAWTFGILGVAVLVLGIWGGISDSYLVEVDKREHSHA